MQMFGVSGMGLSKIRHMQNGGKRARHSVDQWDRVSSPVNSFYFFTVANISTAKYNAAPPRNTLKILTNIQ